MKNELYCFGSCRFFFTWDRRSSSFHIELVHIVSSLLTGYMYPKISPVVVQWIFLAIGFTVIVYFLRFMRAK